MKAAAAAEKDAPGPTCGPALPRGLACRPRRPLPTSRSAAWTASSGAALQLHSLHQWRPRLGSRLHDPFRPRHRYLESCSEAATLKRKYEFRSGPPHAPGQRQKRLALAGPGPHAAGTASA